MLFATVKFLSIFFKSQHFFSFLNEMLFSFNFERGMPRKEFLILKSLMSSFNKIPIIKLSLVTMDVK